PSTWCSREACTATSPPWRSRSTRSSACWRRSRACRRWRRCRRCGSWLLRRSRGIFRGGRQRLTVDELLQFVAKLVLHARREADVDRLHRAVAADDDGLRDARDAVGVAHLAFLVERHLDVEVLLLEEAADLVRLFALVHGIEDDALVGELLGDGGDE